MEGGPGLHWGCRLKIRDRGPRSKGKSIMVYYTAICILLWIALGVLCVLASEDERIGPMQRPLYYATYSIIALSLLAEWGGLMLSDMAGVPTWITRFVKCCDYILTPMAGGALTAQMRLNNKWDKALVGILGANMLFQIVSFFTGWMVVVSSGSGYSHGPLYWIYILAYFAIIIIVVIQFMHYGKSFHRENRMSLWTSAGMVVVGIVLQEALGRDVRTAYIGLTLGAALLYIHSTEFSQQEADDRIRRQQRQITTDALTGALSRHAYARKLEILSHKKKLPPDFAVFSIDANGLKQVNDALGHDAGDELLRGAAQCVAKAFDEIGNCYRIGGDEFVVFAYMGEVKPDDMLARIKQETDRWHGQIVSGLSLSVGYAMASENEGLTCEELVGVSDEAMYAAKAEYYRQEGHDRRHHPRGETAGKQDPGVARTTDESQGDVPQHADGQAVG